MRFDRDQAFGLQLAYCLTHKSPAYADELTKLTLRQAVTGLEAASGYCVSNTRRDALAQGRRYSVHTKGRIRIRHELILDFRR
jgi:hypothetical protein